jgi:hypothetical protein
VLNGVDAVLFTAQVLVIWYPITELPKRMPAVHLGLFASGKSAIPEQPSWRREVSGKYSVRIRVFTDEHVEPPSKNMSTK